MRSKARLLCFLFLFLLLPISLGYGEFASQTLAPIVAAEDRDALLDHYFEQLKDLNANYKVIGYILEELAKIQLKSIYPPDRYEIIGGLQYQEAGGRTVGELDVVVLDQKADNAQLVAEVKLSGNLYQAGQKAFSQLNRFRSYLRAGKINKFHYIAHPSRIFDSSQFIDLDNYWRIGNTGALAAGFDYEIDLRRDEADILQKRLLAYRDGGKLIESIERKAAPDSATDKPFIGNKRSKVLHYHTCYSLPSPKNRIYFSSMDEARSAGYKRIHTCIPENLR